MAHHTTRATMLAAASLALTAGILVPAGSAGAAEPEQPQLAFQSGDYYAQDGAAVYLANADGSGLTDLSQGGVRSWSWAPDGSRIAFVSGRDGMVRLYVADVGGAPVVVADDVFDADYSSENPRWSPDGSRIAFVAGNGDLAVVDVATATSRSVASGTFVSWSPTATHLLYQSGASLFLVGAAGGSSTLLTDHHYDYFRGSAAWSPEGDRLLFDSDVSGDDDIYVVDLTVATPDPVRLTTSPANDGDPAWSPDGTRIAFSSGLETFTDNGDYITVIPSRIHVMNGDGSNRHSITDGSIDYVLPHYSLAQGGPVWSPDGSLLAVMAGRSGPSPHASFFTVYAVDPSGSTSPVRLDDGGGGAFLEWSPAGDRLAVLQTSNYTFPTVTVVTSDGTESAMMAGGFTRSPRWSPDGDFLAYEGFEAWPTGVFVADADGTDPHQIGGSLGHPNGFGAAWRPEPVDPVGMVDPATGRWYLRHGTGWIRSFYFGNPGDIPFLGDWDCDGVDTPGLYRRSDGYVYLRNSNSQGVADLSFFFGNPGDIPIAGDFDGDGCDTVSIYRPSEQTFYIIDRLGSGDGGLGAAASSFLFGNPGDVPIVGDWDGDGVTEIGLHRPSTGFFYWRNTLTTGIGDGEIFFGDPGDRFIAGDWIDHDGRDAPAVFRPGDTTFYVRKALTQGVADEEFVFGRAGWLPVAGDFGP